MDKTTVIPYLLSAGGDACPRITASEEGKMDAMEAARRRKDLLLRLKMCCRGPLSRGEGGLSGVVKFVVRQLPAMNDFAIVDVFLDPTHESPTQSWVYSLENLDAAAADVIRRLGA